MNGKMGRILCTVPVATAVLIMAVQESKGSPIPNGGIFGGEVRLVNLPLIQAYSLCL